MTFFQFAGMSFRQFQPTRRPVFQKMESLPSIWSQLFIPLKIFKGTVMIFLRCVHRVNFIIYANNLKQLCRAFCEITVKPKFQRKCIELTLLSVGWKKHTCTLKYFEQCTWYNMPLMHLQSMLYLNRSINSSQYVFFWYSRNRCF